MKYVLFGISCLALLFAFVFASSYYKEQQAAKIGFMAQENASIFVRDHSSILGSDDAKVYLVEFMDPACGACATFAPFVKQIMDANPGKIKLVIRYAPFHEGADDFVRILEASKKQGKYWETLDAMYKSQRYWTSNHRAELLKIWPFLVPVGLDLQKIKKDMSDPAITKLIEQDLADAKALDLRKTPSFYANGKPLQTFGYEQLQELIQAEIRAEYPNPSTTAE